MKKVKVKGGRSASRNRRIDKLRPSLLRLVREGMPISKAFVAVGISLSTFEKWVSYSRRFERQFFDADEEEKESDQQYFELFQELRREEALWLHSFTSVLSWKRVDWRKSVAVLERRDKDHWSKVKSETDVSDDEVPDESFL